MSKKMKSLSAVTCTLFALVTLLLVVATPTWAQSQQQDQSLFDLDNSASKLSASQDAAVTASRVEMYRIYNSFTGEHLYTSSASERDSNVKAGWKDEGIEWYAPSTSKTPVYRLFNPYTSDHHFTTKKSEYDSLGKSGWKQEGISWYSVDDGDSTRIPLYRQFNPYASTGTHNYTKDTKERDRLIGLGWKDEGVGWYGYTTAGTSAIDFSKATVDTKDKVYQGSQWTPSVSITGLTKNTDYTVTYGTNKNVGTGTITIKGKGSYTGSKTYTFKITQKTISSVKWSATSFNYNGKEQAPTATAVGLCGSDKASVTVSVTGTHKDAGSYVANATKISNSNYKLASNIKVTYKINKVNPTYTTPSTIKAGSVQTLGDLILPKATNGKFTWQDKVSTPVGKAGTTNKFKVTFTPTDTKNYNTVKDLSVSVQVLDVKDHTVIFDNQFQGTTPATQLSQEDGSVVDPSASVGTSEGLKLEGWYTDAKCTNDEEHKWNFATDVVIEDMTLYANWVPADDGDAQKYWISPSMEVTASNTSAKSNDSYVKEAWNVRKSSTQIKSDVNVLIQGDVDGNDTYAQVKAEYDEMMKDDTYHLYTAYNGTDAKADADKFVEFRILEVGEHASDGSALTFQATHALPTASQMFTDRSNVGGWSKSVLRSELQDEGSIFTNFNTGFTGDMIYLEKSSTVGGGQATALSTDITTSSDKLWVTSESEINGSSQAGYGDEGTQYTYYSNIGVNSAGSNKALDRATRSGSTAATSTFEGSFWWERSAFTENDAHFLLVDGNGHFNADANRYGGVVPAFAFGKQKILVQFDTQDHGTEVGNQLVENGELLRDPTDSAGTSEGLVLEGWYKNDPDCNKENRFDFENDTVSEKTVLYANWVPADDGDALKYWISTSKSQVKLNESTQRAETKINEGYVGAAWNVKKSSAEIEADVKVLLKGSVSTNPDYDKVKAEYEEFMTNDNYHLYTKWDGAAAGADEEDGFVEFRILNVGAHDGDESALTFQATHMLTTAAQMNSTSSNIDGWAKSGLRSQLQSGGALYSSFKTGFTDAIFPVSKVSTVGGGSSSAESVENSTSSNVLWITSRSELSGTSANGFKDEGTQYEFYKNLNIKDVAYNACLIMKTRSGDNPTGSSNANSWWERSPNTLQSGSYLYVDSRGFPATSPVSSYKANSSLGVVPSFCFGRSAKHTVKFLETDGTAVSGLKPVTVADGQTFAKPDDPAKDQYEFDGWYTDTSYRDEFKFGDDGMSLDTVSSDLTLYAKWSPVSGKDYWLASPGLTYDSESEYATKDPDHYKSATQVKKDVLAIKNPLAENHDAVVAEYEAYMKDESVHLYTAWGGAKTDSSSVKQAANNYVECRIIQVGDHDGDESGLTFQAVHALPSAQAMNQDSLNAGGWANTALRNSLQGVKQGAPTTLNDCFADGLKKDVMKVSKVSNNGTADKENYTTTKDTFFLLSYNEVTGTSLNNSPKNEGTQYEFFKEKGINANDSNDLLKMTTRAGNRPKNASDATWWLRSPNISIAENFFNVGTSGAPHYTVEAMTQNGVVPAFCF